MEQVSTLTQEASIVALTPHLEAWNATEGLQGAVIGEQDSRPWGVSFISLSILLNSHQYLEGNVFASSFKPNS